MGGRSFVIRGSLRRVVAATRKDGRTPLPSDCLPACLTTYQGRSQTPVKIVADETKVFAVDDCSLDTAADDDFESASSSGSGQSIFVTPTFS